MRRLSLIFIAILFFLIGHSQSSNPNAQKSFEAALPYLDNGDYDNGLNNLLKAYQADPNFIDAIITLANTYKEIKSYDSAVLFYQKAKLIDSHQSNYYNMPYSNCLAGLGKFSEALQAVDQYLKIPNLGDKALKNAQYWQNCYQFAINYAKNHPHESYVFQPINMGDNINSPQAEYYPSFTIDDSTLVFTRRGEGIREDFLESFRDKNGKYAPATLIKGIINDEPSKGALNISQDGQWLIFAGNFGNKGFGNFDLYISYKTENGWSAPQNLGPNINTGFWESSPSLSPDKSTLYFSSNRTGGFGGNDLYVSYMQPNGKWSKAQNMGKEINTSGDELAPFIHADNTTLFYTSSGLPGYGGTDLFKITKTDFANNTWSQPENLGYPINTIDNEGSLFVASDGVTAYYASDRADTRGELDLYKFELRKDIRPNKTSFVSGKITDAHSDKGLAATIELTNNANQQLISKTNSDTSGNYLVTLPVGNDYTITLNRPGYLFQSEIFSLHDVQPSSVFRKNISMQAIEVNAAITLKNIQFAFKSYELEPVSKIELNKLLQLLRENPTLRVRINGHTDNKGSQAVNQPLSAKRAKAVVDFLLGNDIEKSRLEWKGYGDAHPIADNATEEGRALNRRTEVEVIGL
ncbi:OmpA family protein [Rhizosphaericola mali]|uniref:OmpA family protein n=1 Tax=Rhizosphaericola mali TaxID=2545455 RepID=A0A5P2G968_9BACT|nr:OmpA family protein [Rhizosphaericola mali]QES90260.1 OmpA family protein [Rhizosphaericola mali]